MFAPDWFRFCRDNAGAEFSIIGRQSAVIEASTGRVAVVNLHPTTVITNATHGKSDFIFTACFASFLLGLDLTSSTQNIF